MTATLALSSAPAFAAADMSALAAHMDKQVSLSLTPPSVSFSNDVAPAAEPRLKPAEQGLADELKPLLEKRDFGRAASLLSGSRDGRSAALLLVEGQVLLALERYGEAATVLEAALKAQPGMMRAHRAAALGYLKAGNTKDARRHLIAALSLGAQDAQLFGQLAYMNLKDGSPFGAVAGYQQALLLEPASRQWQEGLLHALMQAQHYPSARALVDEMLGERSDDAALWLMRAQLALQSGEEASALASFERAIALGEKRADNLMLAGRIHLRQGSMERGGTLIGRALTAGADFGDAASAIDYLLAEGHLDGAERALKQEPPGLSAANRARYLGFKGAIASARGDGAKAERWLTEALSGAPQNGSVLLALAQLHSAKGESARAELYYVRAAAIKAVRERALLGHAQLAIKGADWRRASELLAQALKDNPARRDLKDNLEQLERLSARR
ncbi:tetratricopeptide repeat protein [Shewanella sp. JM162201]|uniref:Tetratricopeptide repeat protein n=1 Tax=Shewanella jiangmenensis TaxID=2837387 RepID=A0ABS5V2C1_9GAMM|nr:tetratricopeptide repeat protein [Shewanella jiangmenensis]MBT1443776.1 tetratricopeptide repeat protein [Shewanella jiangmenensis]